MLDPRDALFVVAGSFSRADHPMFSPEQFRSPLLQVAVYSFELPN
jgi:hypothetical protein